MPLYDKYTNEIIYDIYQIYIRSGSISIRKGMIEISEINGREHREFVEDGGGYRVNLLQKEKNASYFRYAKEDEIKDIISECISEKERIIAKNKKSLETIEESVNILKEMRDKLAAGIDIKTIALDVSSLDKNRVEWAKQKKREGYTIAEISKALHIPASLISDELKGIKKDKKEPLTYEGVTG